MELPIKSPQFTKCGWSECDNNWGMDDSLSPNYSYLRALYFDAEDDIDFCGADCSTKYYNMKLNTEGEHNGENDRINDSDQG
jgi:hypothetical protein